MIVKEVCKSCKCVDWIISKGNSTCANCGNNNVSAHKYFVPCEEYDLALKNGLEYFVGDLSDFGLTE